MFLLVCGGLIEIPTPALIWIKFLHAHPHLPKEGFGACLIPTHLPLSIKLVVKNENALFKNVKNYSECFSMENLNDFFFEEVEFVNCEFGHVISIFVEDRVNLLDSSPLGDFFEPLRCIFFDQAKHR